MFSAPYGHRHYAMFSVPYGHCHYAMFSAPYGRCHYAMFSASYGRCHYAMFSAPYGHRHYTMFSVPYGHCHYSMFSAPYGRCHYAMFSATYGHGHSATYRRSAVVMNVPSPRTASLTSKRCSRQSLLPFQQSAVPKILQSMSTAINPQLSLHHMRCSICPKLSQNIRSHSIIFSGTSADLSTYI